MVSTPIEQLGGTSDGDAPPVVCLHGFTGDSGAWRPHAASFGARTYAVTLPGHGAAAPVADGFEANVAWIAGHIDAAGLAGCHLVGYSLGARTALGVAVRHPHIAARLTLIGVHPGLATDAEREARRAADARWIDVLRCDGIEAFVEAWEQLPIFATQSGAASERLARQRATRLSHDAEGLARSLEHMGLGAMPDYRPDLAALDVPIRLVTGGLDDKFCALAREITSRAPAIEHTVVAGCGHNVLIEAEAAAWL